MKELRNPGITGLAVGALALMLTSFSALAFDQDSACSMAADAVDAEWVQQERPTRQQPERPTRDRQTQQREREQQEQPQTYRQPRMAQPIHRHELGRFNLREGMTIPQDGRTIGRIITAEDLGRGGLRFDGDDDCICMCNQDGCSPPGCGNCPVPLCPGGYVPPCPDGDSPLPDVYGVLDGLRVLPAP